MVDVVRRAVESSSMGFCFRFRLKLPAKVWTKEWTTEKGMYKNLRPEVAKNKGMDENGRLEWRDGVGIEKKNNNNNNSNRYLV